jgi:hypothetical protein
MWNLLFCIWSNLRATYYVLVCPGHEMSMPYFLCPSEPGADRIKSLVGHVMANLYFYS